MDGSLFQTVKRFRASGEIAFRGPLYRVATFNTEGPALKSLLNPDRGFSLGLEELFQTLLCLPCCFFVTNMMFGVFILVEFSRAKGAFQIIRVGNLEFACTWMKCLLMTLRMGISMM